MKITLDKITEQQRATCIRLKEPWKLKYTQPDSMLISNRERQMEKPCKKSLKQKNHDYAL